MVINTALRQRKTKIIRLLKILLKEGMSISEYDLFFISPIPPLPREGFMECNMLVTVASHEGIN